MDKQEIARILEEVRSDPDLAKALREQKPARTPDEAAAVWADAAARLGYSLSAKELSAYVREAEEDRKKKTLESSAGIESLSEEEMAEAAGGKGHDKCETSYRDRENCWFADACDNVAVIYPGYKCHKFFEDTCKHFMG